MPEEKSDVIADVVESEEVSDITDVDSETTEESSTEKTEGEETTGEVDKTQPSDEQIEKDLLTKGDNIPFQRFKGFIEKRNTKVSGLEGQLGDANVELEDLKEQLNDPVVYRAILQKQGITDPKILNEKMAERGFQVQEDLPKGELAKQLSQGLDLTKTEGWIDLVMRAVDYGAKQHLAPITQRLDSREVVDRLISQEPEARKISELFGVEYGDEKEDMNNPDKGVGKLMKYLNDNPNKMALVKGGHLSKAEALKLALSEQGFTLGKQKGKQEEQQRNKDLKSSQMEDDTQTMPPGMPSSDASVHELLEWAAKNPDKI